MVLIVLLVAVAAGSGLFYAFFVPKGPTTPSPSNSVVGHVRFLSSPNAPPGSIDEVEITLQGIHDASPGERYYAWLQINSENIPPIHWPLTTHNGSLSSSYIDPHLLTNKPYLLLITAEMANTDPLVATGARLYYAELPATPATIQNLAIFDIRPCPQGGSNNICTS